MGILLSVLQGINLLFTVIIPDIQTALQIKSLFELNSNFTVNVTTLSGDAVTADQETIDAVNAWRVKNGLPALTYPDSGGLQVQSTPDDPPAAPPVTGD